MSILKVDTVPATTPIIYYDEDIMNNNQTLQYKPNTNKSYFCRVCNEECNNNRTVTVVETIHGQTNYFPVCDNCGIIFLDLHCCKGKCMYVQVGQNSHYIHHAHATEFMVFRKIDFSSLDDIMLSLDYSLEQLYFNDQ